MFILGFQIWEELRVLELMGDGKSYCALYNQNFREKLGILPILWVITHI